MKKLALLLAAVLVLSLGLAACNSTPASGSTPAGTSTPAASTSSTTGEEKILSIQIGSNPETIDPALNSAVDGGNMIIFAFDNLLGIDENNQIIPALAESWETSEDGLTWTFHLRDGLKWSDGTDLTAEDFVYSWQRVADPDTAAPYGETVLNMVKGYNEAIGLPDAEGNPTVDPDPTKLGVTAPDAQTLVVELAVPCAYFDKLAAFATLSPVNRATIEANGDAWAIDPASYVTSGAFYMSEWVQDSYIMFTKNPNYWNADAIKLDGIKCLLIEDQNASYSAYQTGEAMMIKDVPTEEVPSLRENPEFHVDTNLGTYYISLNNQLEQFSDARVRRALSLAIDRDYVANTLMQGTYTPAYNFIGTGVVDWDGSAFMDNANGGEPYIGTDFDANLAEAKELMAEAGYPDGAGFPTITYSTNDAGYHRVVAEYLQQAWAELGITLQVDVVEWASFTPLRRAGDYEISRNGWLFDYNDPSNQLELLYSTNGNNDGKYNSADFDAAIDASRAEADPEVRSGYLHEAEDILMEDMALIPVAYYNDFYLQSERVTGSWHSPYGYWYFQYADILPEA